jgi:class 3 adenylate cyclase/predicted ATPase
MAKKLDRDCLDAYVVEDKGASPPPPIVAERRRLTVMFCDLEDSTPLSERLDPEDYRDVVRAYQAACAAAITPYGGHIAQYLGDGLLVYFGYPVAHEDDAERAVRAGLGIVAAVPHVSARLPHPVRVRVGIHTGPVVVGEVGGGSRREQLALGETPNVAARLQGVAEPGTVAVSGDTLRLISGRFDCQPLGVPTLKGLSRPVPVYRVLRESGARSRLEASATRGLTPLVGRQPELGVLAEHWRRARAGTGQAVVLVGEPGIGKSRLVHELTERLAAEPHARVEWRCSPYHQASALHPVIDQLQRRLRFAPDDAPADRIARLEQGLASSDLPLPDTVPLFAALLSLPLPDRYAPPTLTPQRLRQRTLEAVVAWLLGAAARQPVLLIVEDLHWADPSTLELLDLLVDRTPAAPLLLVGTCRPGFRPAWVGRPPATELTIGRLDRDEVEAVVGSVAGGRALPPAVLRQVVDRTDGVPLFAEESTRMVLESGLLREAGGAFQATGPLPALAIPATLHDLLTARLDRLAAPRELAQLGAALGREFSYELLRAVAPHDEGTLQGDLDLLVEADLLLRQGPLPRARYSFRHALLRDAAYDSLLRSTRQRYHQQIARVLEERFAETAAAEPELLGHHFTEGGQGERAIPYWQQAGERAAGRSANLEAISHYTRALELLEALPAAPERAPRELALQFGLGKSLAIIRGYGAPEVERAFARARALCQQLGDTPQLMPALVGLWRFYLVRAELQAARELGEELLGLTERVPEPTLTLFAHATLGQTLTHLGHLAIAQRHLERAIALHDPQQHRPVALEFGDGPGVGSLVHAARNLWVLGYPDAAMTRIDQAVALARELAVPLSMALALMYAAGQHLFRREAQLALERAEALIALSTEHGFAFFVTQGVAYRSWALDELGRAGQGEGGLGQQRRSLVARRASGVLLVIPYHFALLAEAYGRAGEAGEGLRLLDEALATAYHTGERWIEAELYRRRGELLLTPDREGAPGGTPHPGADEAEACFRLALAIARRQGAKSWELRAVTSLSRLLQGQGKREEARALLAETYGWFTEGFETGDLREARALLAALA